LANRIKMIKIRSLKSEDNCHVIRQRSVSLVAITIFANKSKVLVSKILVVIKVENSLKT